MKQTNNKNIKILIILKRKRSVENELSMSTGLYNSAKYIEEMLQSCGMDSKLVVVNDNNDIDREVTLFKPTKVIIEALWVVPEKFKILTKLHPNVTWIIRSHSQLPFIANEGNAMKWIGEYVKYTNIVIGVNSPEMLNEISFYTKEPNKIVYLPNYYPNVNKIKSYKKNDDKINIACFGAIRPLKNHLTQAISAIKFAEKIKKKLHFHINGSRIEQKGESILNNLIELFNKVSNDGHKLILHEWLDKDDFLNLCSKMDIGLQCSFSETFNIVGADIISQGVPLIGSAEIPWLDLNSIANPTKSEEIYKKLLNIHLSSSLNVLRNQQKLNRYTNKSKNIWTNYFNNNM